MNASMEDWCSSQGYVDGCPNIDEWTGGDTSEVNFGLTCDDGNDYDVIRCWDLGLCASYFPATGGPMASVTYAADFAGAICEGRAVDGWTYGTSLSCPFVFPTETTE